MIEKNNDESTDQRSMHRSVKAIMDILQNPILQNKIVLNDEIFATITKNFYNGN